MSYHSSPIPFISISPAPEEDPIVEPFSPFSALSFPPSDQDAFRPSHLTPPTTITSFKRSLSPFHPVLAVGKGLESQKFQVLLAASKKRKASGGSNQSVEFRKEIAMKAHKNGHSDRRTLFLSKLQAPSPTAMTTSKETPPESSGIFPNFLSSPALESSLTLFDSWSGNHGDDVSRTWVECDDFDERSKYKPSLNRSSTKPARGLPSLDQISARFSRPAKLDNVNMTCDAHTMEHSSRPSVGIGRLKMPLRTPLQTQVILQSGNQPKQFTRSKPLLAPLSLEPSTQTFSISRSAPVQLTQSNLNSLNSRDQKASNMLFTLRKRRVSSEFNPTAGEETAIYSEERDATYKSRWRRSAPADMTPLRARFGFEHPVLASPGGF
jgi:hypothetical protein